MAQDESEPGFRRRIAYSKECGARDLGVVIEDFLLEAHRQNIRQRDGKRPRPQEDRERKVKHDFIARLRSYLESLRYVEEPVIFAPGRWFDGDDVAKVLDKDAVLNVVRMCIRYLPPDKDREYADAILRDLSEFYRKKGEQIVLERPITSGNF